MTAIRTLASGGDPEMVAAKRAAKEAQRAARREEFDRSLTEFKGRVGPGGTMGLLLVFERPVSA